MSSTHQICRTCEECHAEKMKRYRAGWESVERIFWAFQFSYLLGVHADHGPNSAPDVDENRGYQ